MPTTFTAPIEDGKRPTLREFALHCAMAFDVAIAQRDSGATKPAYLDESYFAEEQEELERAERKLNEYKKRGLNDWDMWYHEYRQQIENANRRLKGNYDELNRAYTEMRDKVESWDVSEATTDFPRALKEFMLNQLDISKPYPYTPSIAKNINEWKEHVLDQAEKDVIYAKERLGKAKNRVVQQHRRLDDLMMVL